MSTAFKCELCQTYRDGIPDKMPETWAISPTIHVELHGFNIHLDFEARVRSLSAEICNECQRRIVALAVNQMAMYRPEPLDA